MTRVLFAIFLVAHGAVHAPIWLAPHGEAAPFDPGHSWLLGRLGLGAATARSIGIALATLDFVSFAGAGIALVARQEWWRALAVSAAAVSLVLLIAYYHAWLTFGVAINAGIVLALTWADWPTPEAVGV
jgi:hypothetical protein